MPFLKCLCALLCILGKPHYYRYAPMCEKVLFLVVQQLALIQLTKDIGDVGWQRKISSDICNSCQFLCLYFFQNGVLIALYQHSAISQLCLFLKT